MDVLIRKFDSKKTNLLKINDFKYLQVVIFLQGIFVHEKGQFYLLNDFSTNQIEGIDLKRLNNQTKKIGFESITVK